MVNFLKFEMRCGTYEQFNIKDGTNEIIFNEENCTVSTVYSNFNEIIIKHSTTMEWQNHERITQHETGSFEINYRFENGGKWQNYSPSYDHSVS